MSEVELGSQGEEVVLENLMEVSCCNDFCRTGKIEQVLEYSASEPNTI